MLSDKGISIDGLMFVSCITLTNGCIDLVEMAIKSFLSQTYVDREMIIVSKGNAEQNLNIRKMIEDDSDIHFVEVPSKLTIGETRNLSVELSHGDIICQWDEGCFYHPQRIVTQFKVLRGDAIASLFGCFDESVMFKKEFFHQADNLLYPENDDKDVLQKLMDFGTIVSMSESIKWKI
jgi:glycosyltransferase involved in cell wall biosynthesis